MNKYDIFISYRRDGGKEWARMLSLELERLGYSVFLDFDELKDGIFDKRIMNAIESAPIFMIILSPHSLDRCVNEDDWVRREIEYAISHSRHFVPINPDCTFTGFPEDLPDGLKNGLGLHQFSEIMMGQLFKESVEKMVRYRIAPIVRVAGETAVQGNVDSLLKIETDLACRIFVDYENRGEAHPGKLTRLQLRGGSYRIRFVSLDNAADYVENMDFKIGHNTEEWYTVSLMPLKKQRERMALEAEKEKEKRKQRLALPYNRFKEYTIDGRKGFVDSVTGEILVPCSYDDVGNFSEGLCIVKKNGKWGFIDMTGKEVIPCIYDGAREFREFLAPVRKNGKYGFIDWSGKEVIPCIYDFVFGFREGLASVEKNGKWGIIDKSGKEVIPCIYDNSGIVFREGLASVKKNGKWGIIDESGKEVVPYIYDFVFEFREGLASVRKNGKWGIIDESGKEVIPCIYDSDIVFREGLASVKKNGKYGFIDKSGKEVIPCIYDGVIDSFRKGFAMVEKNGKQGIIDKSGKEVIPCIYDDIGYFIYGLASVKKNGKWGVIDKSGKEVIPPLYSYVGDFTGGYAKVKKGRFRTYYIDRKGKLMLLKTVRHFILSMFELS